MKKIISTGKSIKVKSTFDDLDPLKKFKKLYVVLPLIGALVLFFATFSPAAIIFGAAIGAGIAWFILSATASARILKLDFKKYTLPENVTVDHLFQYLKTNIVNPDIQIDKGFAGIKLIYKNITIHTVYLDEEKKTYTISSAMTKNSRRKNGGKTNSIKLYTYAVQAIPIIQNILEEASISLNKSK